MYMYIIQLLYTIVHLNGSQWITLHMATRLVAAAGERLISRPVKTTMPSNLRKYTYLHININVNVNIHIHIHINVNVNIHIHIYVICNM